MSSFNKEIFQKSYSIYSGFCFAAYEHFGESTNINIPIPYESALPDDCGIGCAAMLLRFRHLSIPSVQELSQQYKNEKYYLDKVGWKHDGLVSILENFGINAHRAGHQSIFQIIHSLKNNLPVIASLRVPAIDNLSQDGIYVNRDKSQPPIGHLCVVVGIKNKNILLHDPRNIRNYKDNLIVPLADFKRVFTGRCIYLE